MHTELVERCKGGERQAQNEVYKLYNRAMYNTCFRMVGDQDEAADVLQEAFLSAFMNIGQFEAQASFGAWLKRVVVNTCINHIRKRKMVLESVEDHHLEAIEEEQTDWNEHELQVERIKSAMQRLPDGFRQVFSMYMLEGYSHAEIAEVMEISESTSKSQLNRAKKKLKEIL